ncbi:MAG: HEAT repeat domain-containing protein [Kiritimatiellae bacterium]|nr:HEAT repeat domain-containing protein [Kiritimatiellia bacterium]
MRIYQNVITCSFAALFKSAVFVMSVFALSGVIMAGEQAKPESLIKVGVFPEQEKAVCEYLNGVEGIKAEYLPKTGWIEKIYDYDALFLGAKWQPNYMRLDSDIRVRLIEYVCRGHGLLLAHDSYNRWFMHVLFPEFQSPDSAGQRYGCGMKVAKPDHPVAAGLDPIFYHCYPEHAPMTVRQSNGVEIVCTDTDEEARPLVVASAVGKGRVVAAGIYFALNYSTSPESSAKNVGRLLVNSIRWVGGVAERETGAATYVRPEIRLQAARAQAALSADQRIKDLYYTIDNELSRLWFTVDAMQGGAEKEALLGQLAAAQETARQNQEKFLQKEIAAIRRQSLEALQASSFEGNEVFPMIWRETIFPETITDMLRDKVAGFVASHEKKARPMPSEENADTARLMKDIKDGDLREQSAAALEIGRLEYPEAVSELVELLAAPDDAVFRNAVYALSWMRAHAAVPALSGIVQQNQDPWRRCRAIQALGMIGDRQATAMLIPLLNNSADFYLVENAIISLGWLRDTNAIPGLVKIIREGISLEESGLNAELKGQASKALGEIGGNAAAEELAKLLEANLKKDAPHQFLYGLCLGLGKCGTTQHIPLLEKAASFAVSKKVGGRGSAFVWGGAQYAVAAIKSAKQTPATSGIVQPAFLKTKKNFYVANNRYHRIFQRVQDYWCRPASQWLIHQYAGQAGGNGINQMVSYLPYKSCAFFNDSKWVDMQMEFTDYFMHSFEDAGLKLFPGGPCPDSHETFTKLEIAALVDEISDFPAFGGIWREEWPMNYASQQHFDFVRCGVAGPYFVSRLKEKIKSDYPAEMRGQLGLTDNALNADLLKNMHLLEIKQKNPVLYAECIETADAMCLEYWRENADWLRQRRKNTPIMYDITVAPACKGYTISVYAKLGMYIDSPGTEPSYSPAAYDNAFLAELCRDGEARPVGMEVYMFRAPDARHYDLGMAIGMAHSQRFMNYVWGQAFKHPGTFGEERGNWKPGMWETVTKSFQKAEKLERYLINVETPRQLGLVYSGRTTATVYGRFLGPVQTFTETRYAQNLRGWYEALCHAHAQFNLIWAETLSAKKIDQYKTLIIPDARSLTPGEEAIIRNWVNKGGVLIGTASTSLCDRWGREEQNYRFSDVFGVNFTGREFMGTNDNKFFDLPRDLVEKQYVAEADVKADWFTGRVEYDLRAGYDKVNPVTAQVLGTWRDGSPALTLNSYGKGYCLFLTGIGAGLACQYKEVLSSYPLYREYYPGNIALLKGLLAKACDLSHTPDEIIAENCPETVEIVLKDQDGGKRKIIQILNYKANIKAKISGITLKVKAPKSAGRVFYPDNNQDMVFERQGDYLRFGLRDLDIHEMVIIE